jgi:NAD(P)-dependent dehydrogenase (short-subunit alcohol dehydrogenase family)
MAIRALHQSFFHPMMERHVELRLHVDVARVAEFRLSLGQQELIGQSLVGRMAAEAAEVILAMRRARKVRVILAGAVAHKAALIDGLRRCLLETKDLGGIPGIIDVVTPRSVAGFAALLGRSAMLVERRLPMRRFLEILVEVFVTGFAGFRAHVFG